MSYIVEIGNVEIATFPSSYSISDIGRQVDRLQFVNNSAIYFWDKGYSPAFKDIRFSGEDMLTVLDSIKTMYEAQDIISFTDIYGHSYTNCIIKNFTYRVVKTKEVGGFDVELVVMSDNLHVFKVGGSIIYGIESCSIAEKVNDIEIVNMSSVSVKTYQNQIFDISISGTELISAGVGQFTGTLGNTVFDFTAPNGITYKSLVVNKNISLIEGVNGFQKFTLNLISGVTDDIFIGVGDAVVESWSVTDDSARLSYHKTIGGMVLQRFSSVTKQEVTFTVYTLDTNLYIHGNNGSATLDGVVYNGVVTSKSISPVDGSDTTKKLSISITVI